MSAGVFGIRRLMEPDRIWCLVDPDRILASCGSGLSQHLVDPDRIRIGSGLHSGIIADPPGSGYGVPTPGFRVSDPDRIRAGSGKFSARRIVSGSVPLTAGHRLSPPQGLLSGAVFSGGTGCRGRDPAPENRAFQGSNSGICGEMQGSLPLFCLYVPVC